MLKDKKTGRNKKILAENDFMVTERDSLRKSVKKKTHRLKHSASKLEIASC